MTDTAAPLPGVHPVPSRERKTWLGYLLYLTAAILFGVNGTVSKAIMLTGITPERLSQFRATSAFLVLLIFMLVTNRKALKIKRSEIKLILAYGVLGVTMTQYLYFVAIKLLPVGVALLIEFTAPIMIALWVRFAYKENVRPTVWVGLFLALAGLGLVGEVWNGLTLNGLGVAAALGAAVALALYYLAGEKGLKDRDPVSLTTWGFGSAAVFWALVAPVWTFPWETLQGSTTLDNGLTLPIAGLATYMVLFGTVTSFALVLFSLRHLSASQASAVGMTEPLFASAVAFILLGEVLTSIQLVGAATVLIGVFIAENSR